MLLCEKELSGKNRTCPCVEGDKRTWRQTKQACEAEGYRLCASKAELNEQMSKLIKGLGSNKAKVQARKCKGKLALAYTQKTKRNKGKKRLGFCCSDEGAAAPDPDPHKCSAELSGTEFRLYEDGPDTTACKKDAGELVLCKGKSGQTRVAKEWCAKQGGRLCDNVREVQPMAELIGAALDCGDACATANPSFDRSGPRCFYDNDNGAYRTQHAGASGSVQRNAKGYLFVHHAGTTNQRQQKHLLCCFGPKPQRPLKLPVLDGEGAQSDGDQSDGGRNQGRDGDQGSARDQARNGDQGSARNQSSARDQSSARNGDQSNGGRSQGGDGGLQSEHLAIKRELKETRQSLKDLLRRMDSLEL